jgi:hypothetical protein
MGGVVDPDHVLHVGRPLREGLPRRGAGTASPPQMQPLSSQDALEARRRNPQTVELRAAVGQLAVGAVDLGPTPFLEDRHHLGHLLGEKAMRGVAAADTVGEAMGLAVRIRQRHARVSLSSRGPARPGGGSSRPSWPGRSTPAGLSWWPHRPGTGPGHRSVPAPLSLREHEMYTHLG